MRNLLVTLLMASTPLLGLSQDKVSTYISNYQHIAIAEMNRSGIPASITLAQGMFESAYGQSPSALSYNNHFGIKCKKEWSGAFFFKEDDDRDKNGKLIPSCFRAYDTVSASFEDHTNFLVERERYAELFNFSQTDYYNWALGLERCGYATNKMYAERLIQIIERYALYQYDVPIDASPVYVSVQQQASSLPPVASDAYSEVSASSALVDMDKEVQALTAEHGSSKPITPDSDTDLKAPVKTLKVLDTFQEFSSVAIHLPVVPIDTIPIAALTMEKKEIKTTQSRVNQAIILPASYQRKTSMSEMAASELRE